MSREQGGLGAFQKDILRCLLHHTQRQRLPDYPSRQRAQGVPVKWIRPKGVSRVDSASFSRAIRRLEARGLVIRTNYVSGCPAGENFREGQVRLKMEEPAPKRTNSIILTPTGEEIAKRLT